VHRGADRDGTVEHDGGLDPLRHRGLKEREFGPDAVDRLDNVGAGLPEDNDRYRWFSIKVACGAKVLRRVYDRGNIRKMHCRAVMITNDQRFVLVCMGDLIVRNDVGGNGAICDLSPGFVGVLQAQD